MIKSKNQPPTDATRLRLPGRSSDQKHHLTASALSLALIVFVLLSGPAAAEDAPKANACRKGEFIRNIILTGALRARDAEIFTIPPNPTFQVKIKWLAPEGKTVKPGDIVVQLDNSTQLPEIERLSISLRTKNEQLTQLLSELRNLEKELDINVEKAGLELQKAKLDASIPRGVIDDHKYDQNQLALERAAKNLESAKSDRVARLNSKKAELEKLKIEISQEQDTLALNRQQSDAMTLRAKTSGPVIWEEHRWERRKIQVGDNVFTSMAVASIPQETSLEVDAWLPENAINFVKPGQPVVMRMDAYPTQEFTGKVIKIAENAETINQWGKGGYFRTRVSIEKLTPEIMKSGMSVQCVVETARIPDMLLIPLEYARFRDGKFLVHPKGKTTIPIEPTGFNYTHLALNPGAHPDIAENVILEKVSDEPIRKTAPPTPEKPQTVKKTGAAAQPAQSVPVSDAPVEKSKAQGVPPQKSGIKTESANSAGDVKESGHLKEHEKKTGSADKTRKKNRDREQSVGGSHHAK